MRPNYTPDGLLRALLDEGVDVRQLPRSGPATPPIISFLQHAVTDAEGVHRRPRKRRRTSPSITEWTPTIPARSGAPPPQPITGTL